MKRYLEKEPPVVDRSRRRPVFGPTVTTLRKKRAVHG